MNSYSAQPNQIDIFASSAQVDIFDTSSTAAQTVDIFAASGPTSAEVDIFASDAQVDIFAAVEPTQQIDIFGASQVPQPASIWSNEGNSQASVGTSTDPLNVKFDTLLQALNSESLSGVAAVVQSAKNLYNNGLGR